ncbi:MAG TPA: FtsQ-type POTRA domain-containing protein [Blastocatellia bacterium]|nr:FtsQ-type POTRA domain-containing protein [Blastocatellia bacterium]
MKGRSQPVTPRRSRRLAQSRGRLRAAGLRRLLDSGARFAKPATAAAVLLIAIFAYGKVTSSKVFSLHRVDIAGASTGLQTEIRQVVERFIGQSGLLDVDLVNLDKKIESIPRVRSAWVMRTLPDVIRVEVSERQPAVLVRRQSGALVWLDADAIEIGDASTIKAPGGVPPIARGFSDGPSTPASVAEDQERIAMYKQIQKEFSSEPNPIWNLVDEIDLSYIKLDVDIHLARSAVPIYLGNRDFRARAEKALDMLDATAKNDVPRLISSHVRVQDAERMVRNPVGISFIDVARPDIVVGFSTSGPGTKPGSNATDTGRGNDQKEKKQDKQPKAHGKQR